MAGKPFSLKQGIIYIVLGGVVLFVAVTLGIQVGFALRGDGTAELSPETLPNRSLMKPGDALPDLTVYTLDGKTTLLGDVIGGKKTVIGVAMPGCDPCKQLLTTWVKNGMVNGANDFQIILLASTTPETRELGPLADFSQHYPVYFCDHSLLKEQFGISTFPTVMGTGIGNKVSFVANGYVHQLDTEFFNKYL